MDTTKTGNRTRLRRQIVVGLVGIAAAVAAYQIYKKVTSEKDNLPGPDPSNKDMGNFADMGKAGSLHEYLEELTNKYGRIGAFWWGQTRVAYITSRQILLDAANKKVFKNHCDRPPFLFDGFKPLIGKHSIQYANGAEFKARYHSVWLAAYQRKMIPKIPILSKLTQQTVDNWTTLINDKNDEKECNQCIVVDMMHESFIFSSRSTISASFGSNISEELRSAIVEGYEYGWDEMEKRLVDGIPSTAERDAKLEQALNKIRGSVKSILSESHNPDKNSFLSCILKEKALYDTEEKIMDEAVTAVVGGTHTTGTGLAWLFYYVAKEAEIAEKMFNEIQKHFDIHADIEEMDANLVADKIKKLIYCKQVITETLRISCVAPWSARVNYETDMILNKCDGIGGKVKIKKGMAYIIGQGVSLNDTNVFADACVFKPERWDRKHLKQNKILQESQDAIFGGLGGRMCPGWSFFRTEALIFVVGLMSKFKFQIVDDRKMQTKYGLVASPKQKVEIQVRKR